MSTPSCAVSIGAPAEPAEPAEGPLAYGVTEPDSGICDLCHRRGAVRYLDYDWLACEKCRQRYIRKLFMRG